MITKYPENKNGFIFLDLLSGLNVIRVLHGEERRVKINQLENSVTGARFTLLVLKINKIFF